MKNFGWRCDYVVPPPLSLVANRIADLSITNQESIDSSKNSFPSVGNEITQWKLPPAPGLSRVSAGKYPRLFNKYKES